MTRRAMSLSDVAAIVGIAATVIGLVWYLATTLTRIELTQADLRQHLQSIEATVQAIYQGAQEP